MIRSIAPRRPEPSIIEAAGRLQPADRPDDQVTAEVV
jgi:hypothetical protein